MYREYLTFLNSFSLIVKWTFFLGKAEGVHFFLGRGEGVNRKFGKGTTDILHILQTLTKMFVAGLNDGPYSLGEDEVTPALVKCC